MIVRPELQSQCPIPRPALLTVPGQGQDSDLALSVAGFRVVQRMIFIDPVDPASPPMLKNRYLTPPLAFMLTEPVTSIFSSLSAWRLGRIALLTASNSSCNWIASASSPGPSVVRISFPSIFSLPVVLGSSVV